MKSTTTLHLAVLCILAVFISNTFADQKTSPPKYDEADLKNRYDAFLLDLDYLKVATDYPKVIKDLLSGNAVRQDKAIRMLGESGELAVIPWLVPFLDSDDASLRVWAGCAINKVISACALKRRDPTKLDRVALRPLKAGEPDLRPLAWLALKMFRKPDDGNTHAYAATVTRYVEVREFEDELRTCFKSRHPAVSTTAKWVLEALDFQVVEEKAQPNFPLNGSPPIRSETNRPTPAAGARP